MKSSLEWWGSVNPESTEYVVWKDIQVEYSRHLNVCDVDKK